MKDQKQIWLVIAVLLIIFSVFIYILFFRKTATVDSFERCAAAGYPVAESYPRQCHTPDGKNFVENISDIQKTLPPTSNTQTPTTQQPGATTGNNTSIACTLEAKICPDGSAVGRVGPNCEFAACPGEK